MKAAPAGFYSTADEDFDAKRQKLDPAVHGMELSQMEGRHAKEEEEKLRAKDKKALKKLFKENAPLAITKVTFISFYLCRVRLITCPDIERCQK